MSLTSWSAYIQEDIAGASHHIYLKGHQEKSLDTYLCHIRLRPNLHCVLKTNPCYWRIDNLMKAGWEMLWNQCWPAGTSGALDWNWQQHFTGFLPGSFPCSLSFLTHFQLRILSFQLGPLAAVHCTLACWRCECSLCSLPDGLWGRNCTSCSSHPPHPHISLQCPSFPLGYKGSPIIKYALTANQCLFPSTPLPFE